MYLPKNLTWPRIEQMIKDGAFLLFLAVIGFIASYEIYVFIVRNIRFIMKGLI